MTPRLPSEQEKRVVIDFLRDSTNVWVEGVHFQRLTDGAMEMRCRYRDLKDHTHEFTIGDPAPKDDTAFENLAVAMSDFLDHMKLDWLTDPKERASVQ
jgi:hypothetical protein